MAFESFIHLMKGLQGKVGLGSSSGTNLRQAAYVRNLQKELKQQDSLFVPLNQLNVVIFDLETTGFYPEQGDRIISIGAVKMIGGERCEEFYSLARYENELPPVIEQLTGLTPEQLSNAPALTDVLVQFYRFAQHSTLVAHHSKHDKSFLQNANWKLFRSPFKHRVVDTSFFYRIADPDCSFSRLDELCEYHQIPIIDRHHALGDARLTAEIWRIYIEKVQALGCKTLHDVYRRMANKL
ncbi:exonuclease domain-containing protein [Bacillus tuaregi]|uniref:exonuclease domain-containing protein n=1 Tax=Bacillus tuaregi TaxID=1816695 RepID=UPI0008F94B81|nr:exonuclease domain-containing protein [Bacillus tuaregi]